MDYKIMIEKNIVEVTAEVYYAYHRMANHEEYMEKRDIYKGLTYYHALDTEDRAGEESLRDTVDVLESIVKKEEYKLLHSALEQLQEADKQLIEALYFEGQTERDVAERMGVTQPAIHKKKKRILEEIKNFLKK